MRKSESAGELTEALKDVSRCLEQVIQDTRTLTLDLSDPILYELGFEAAVAEWLTDQIQEKHGIETEFVDDGRQKPLDDDIRVLLFRNVRELLINVVKHAQANKVRVAIHKVGKHIEVSVEDDGVGFDPVEVASMAAKRAEFGLFSIRERLEQLGGRIEIHSEPGRGSRITMIAPLKYDNSKDEI
jgi:signal transduction histidine kinase